jgi:tetratricopeptide (TPR) repeat protein
MKSNTRNIMKSRRYLFAGTVTCILVIAILFLFFSPFQSQGAVTTFDNAGSLYSKSVDLANEGKYKEALEAADKALAQNVTSLIPIIQANRAGILVALGRNNEAVTAADFALASHDNLTTTFSIAYFNKGNALYNLGRIEEAKAAYAQAHKLDPTLVSPL